MGGGAHDTPRQPVAYPPDGSVKYNLPKSILGPNRLSEALPVPAETEGRRGREVFGWERVETKQRLEDPGAKARRGNEKIWAV